MLLAAIAAIAYAVTDTVTYTASGSHKGKPSKTLAVYMHPSSTLQLLPMPSAMARAGVHVLCAGSRFARNDTPPAP